MQRQYNVHHRAKLPRSGAPKPAWPKKPKPSAPKAQKKGKRHDRPA
jgi:hypothetical protein